MAIREYDRPMLSDDVETAQTIAMMEELAARDAPTRTVIDATHEALSHAGLTLDSEADAKARAIYWYLQARIRYVPVPGTSPLVDQTLIPPATVLAMPEPEADCPQFSMLAAAMLRVCCVASHFKTIAADPLFPDTYSHVYNVVDIGGGRFLPFDSSNGPAPGAEYANPSKARVWPQQGSTCRVTKGNDRSMLHSSSRPARGYRNATLRGALGIAFLPLSGVECDADGNCYTDGVLTSPQYADPSAPSDTSAVPQSQADTAAGYAALYPGGSPAAGSGANAYSLATALAADAAGVAAPFVKAATQQAPYLIAGPNGTAVLYNPNTETSSASGVTGALSSLSPSMLLVGLLVIGGLALAGGKK